MAHDTTCVNAFDKDGVMFSATPSGAWLPSVIAGDTGIPLTERAQSFLLVPGHPNELAGGKRPRVTLSPTLVTGADGKPFMVFSTPGGDNQEQSLIQIFFNAAFFGMNAEQAIEAPRFQTRHLVSSFDNHAMNPGDLLLDDRISPQVMQELAGRGHKVETRPRTNSGAAPVMIKVTPAGVFEAGADPWYNRQMQAWWLVLLDTLFDLEQTAARFDRDRLRDRLAGLQRAAFTSAAVPGSMKAGWTRSIPARSTRCAESSQKNVSKTTA